MKFLLDTHAVIAILKGEPAMLARLRAYQPADFGMPAIVAHELYYGAYKSQRAAANVARVEALQFEGCRSMSKMLSTPARFVRI